MRVNEKKLTHIMYEFFQFCLHSPVSELHSAQLVCTHNRFSIWKWHFLALQINNTCHNAHYTVHKIVDVIPHDWTYMQPLFLFLTYRHSPITIILPYLLLDWQLNVMKCNKNVIFGI